MQTVKEYAEINKVSVQSVYAQLRRKTAKTALKGHIQKDPVKGMLLDEFAVDWLKARRRTNNPIVVEDTTEQTALIAKVEELQNQLITAQKMVEELKEARAKAEKDLLQSEIEHQKELREKEQRLNEYAVEVERLKGRGLIQRILNK